MLPRWESVWEKRFVGCGKGYEAVGFDCILDCGRVDGYNEERCETILVLSTVREKGTQGLRGRILPFTQDVRRFGL